MWYAVRSDGKILATDDAGEGGTYAIDPSGRYVAAVTYKGERGVPRHGYPYSVWLADFRKGRVVKRIPIIGSGSVWIEWRGAALQWNKGPDQWRTLYKLR